MWTARVCSALLYDSFFCRRKPWNKKREVCCLQVEAQFGSHDSWFELPVSYQLTFFFFFFISRVFLTLLLSLQTSYSAQGPTVSCLLEPVRAWSKDFSIPGPECCLSEEIILSQLLSYIMDLSFGDIFNSHSKLCISLKTMKNHGNRKGRKFQKVYTSESLF